MSLTNDASFGDNRERRSRHQTATACHERSCVRSASWACRAACGSQHQDATGLEVEASALESATDRVHRREDLTVMVGG